MAAIMPVPRVVGAVSYTKISVALIHRKRRDLVAVQFQLHLVLTEVADSDAHLDALACIDDHRRKRTITACAFTVPAADVLYVFKSSAYADTDTMRFVVTGTPISGASDKSARKSGVMPTRNM